MCEGDAEMFEGREGDVRCVDVCEGVRVERGCSACEGVRVERGCRVCEGVRVERGCEGALG